jgi:hypothetical protein
MTEPLDLEPIKTYVKRLKARGNLFRDEVMLLDLFEEVERLRAQVAAVRALHRKWPETSQDFCRYDSMPWPCPTARALDGGAS